MKSEKKRELCLVPIIFVAKFYLTAGKLDTFGDLLSLCCVCCLITCVYFSFISFYGSSSTQKGEDDDIPILPGYFRMLTLLAVYIFDKYVFDDGGKIDCILFEVGMGGRYDATNTFLADHMVRGVTLIDYDHCRVLGNTLEEIAWEKGGIFTVGKGDSTQQPIQSPHPVRDKHAHEQAVATMHASAILHHDQLHSNQIPPHPCFALDTNTEGVLDVLRLCAMNEGLGAQLQIVDTKNQTRLSMDCPMGLKGDHQRLNAEMAIQLCEAVMHPVQAPLDLVQRALADASWPGRCQTLMYHTNDPLTTLRLDGAHTIQSIQAGLSWYQSVVMTGCCKVLIFNCSHERNPVELLLLLQSANFHAVYFCTPDSTRPSAIAKASAVELLTQANITIQPDLLVSSDPENIDTTTSWLWTLASIWKHLESDIQCPVDLCVNLDLCDAIQRGMQLGKDRNASCVEILVTGSLYLVGSVLNAVHWNEQEATGRIVDSKSS